MKNRTLIILTVLLFLGLTSFANNISESKITNAISDAYYLNSDLGVSTLEESVNKSINSQTAFVKLGRGSCTVKVDTTLPNGSTVTGTITFSEVNIFQCAAIKIGLWLDKIFR